MVNKKAKIVLQFLIFFAFIIAVLLMYFVFATITVSTGGTAFSAVNENTTARYNVTVDNVAETFAGNITKVNVTVPSGFAFIKDSQGTSTTDDTYTFANTSSFLVWSNASLVVMNLTNQSFWFNITSSSTPGDYGFIIIASNESGDPETQNLSVTVTDTVYPLMSYGTGIAGNSTNVSRNWTYVNVSATDRKGDTITFLLYNSTGQVNSTSYRNLTSYSDYSKTINWTNLPDETYTYNVTVNDTTDNSNTTSTRTITLDITNPTVTAFECTPTEVREGDAVSCSCSGSDDTSGVNSTSYTVNPPTSSAGTHSTTCTITDFAGNSVSSSVSYIVTGSGGTPGTSTPSFWTSTYVYDDKEFSEQEPLTKELAIKRRIRVKIGGASHHIGVISLTSTTATINISSTPQQATLTVGDERKLDVLEDDYYDIKVTLNSIADDKADITIKSIHEEITVETIAAETEAEAAAAAEAEGEEEVSNKWIWIIVVVIVILIIIGGGYGLKKRRNESI